MSNPTYDRTTQDVGNVINLEHVNVKVTDQLLAHLFYVSGMGFTRDPYMDFGLRNMWVNLGRQQFHLPVGPGQILRGRTGVVVPSLDDLEARLERVSEHFEGTRFACRRSNGHCEVTTPWGNLLDVFGPGEFGTMRLGMPYVRFDVPAGTADGIARFYREVLAAPSAVIAVDGAPCARIAAGPEQTLQYRETDDPLPEYDGHHIAIYVADFSGPHQRLAARGLITEESNDEQYRFVSIVDPDSGERLFDIEHEVRSLKHPMYTRNLVNRNPAQTIREYTAGADMFNG